MQTKLSQLVESFFRNSPSWPIPSDEIDVEGETVAFLADDAEREYSREEVLAAILAFVEACREEEKEIAKSDDDLGAGAGFPETDDGYGPI